MKILVTGANGFIGARLCKQLEAQNHMVLRYDVAQGDLSSKGALLDVEKVDFVYHLAARTFVPDSWKESASFYESNVMGTVTILEYCREQKIPLVALSTYVYGNPQYLPVDEEHPLAAPTPYHHSKLLCESLCDFYAQKYQMDIRVMRPFNIYGNGQSEAFLLPKILKQLLSGEQPVIEVFDLSPKRDYIYIDDVIQALVQAQTPWKGIETFNIGTGVSTSVKEVIEVFLQQSKIEKTYRGTDEKRFVEIDDCCADIAKARKILGFEPQYTLAQGLAKWLAEVGK